MAASAYRKEKKPGALNKLRGINLDFMKASLVQYEIKTMFGKACLMGPVVITPSGG